MSLSLRPLRLDDVEHVRWALYQAVAWDPERVLPPYEFAIDHPELARYHVDWGRPGDLGVIAESDDRVAGVALLRLFTDKDASPDSASALTPRTPHYASTRASAAAS